MRVVNKISYVTLPIPWIRERTWNEARLIDMHDVEAKPTLLASAVRETYLARKMFYPGKNNSMVVVHGRREEGRGRVSGASEGGKLGSLEMHVVARVTTRKSPPSARRIRRRRRGARDEGRTGVGFP